MRAHGGDGPYRSCDVALLRAARAPIWNAPARWPDPTSPGDSMDWLSQLWAREPLTEAIRVASPGFADRVETLLSEGARTAKQIRRATASVVRYTLRGSTRATPFGLFAGVCACVVVVINASGVGRQAPCGSWS
jgi:lantibiotic biosynthesis protein